MSNFDFARFHKYVKTILQRDIKLRSPYDIQLLSSLLQNLPFFQKYTHQFDVIENCCKYMKLEFLPKHKPVFLIDTQGDKFYLVLAGKVGIYIRKGAQPQEPAQANPQARRRTTNIQTKLTLETYTKGLEKVAELGPGIQFGELALASDRPRSATVMCLEDSHFGTLEKKDFNLILKISEENARIKEIGQCFYHPLLNCNHFCTLIHSTALSQTQKLFIIMNSKVKQYSQFQTVVKEGDPMTHIFMIKQGDFVVTALPSTFQINKHIVLEKQDNPEQDMIALNLKKNKLKKRKMRVKQVTSNEIVGLEDVHLKHYSFELQCCTSYGEVLAIEKAIYNYRIANEQNAKNYATSIGVLHQETNQSRINLFKKNIQHFITTDRTDKPTLDTCHSNDEYFSVGNVHSHFIKYIFSARESMKMHKTQKIFVNHLNSGTHKERVPNKQRSVESIQTDRSSRKRELLGTYYKANEKRPFLSKKSRASSVHQMDSDIEAYYRNKFSMRRKEGKMEEEEQQSLSRTGYVRRNWNFLSVNTSQK